MDELIDPWIVGLCFFRCVLVLLCTVPSKCVDAYLQCDRVYIYIYAYPPTLFLATYRLCLGDLYLLTATYLYVPWVSCSPVGRTSK